MDQVFITDLVAHGILGVDDEERQAPRDILINVVLFTDTKAAAESDKLLDCVDYRLVAEKILKRTADQRFYTVEALASDLANVCLEDARVKKVRVRVEKPGALPVSKSVGVEIERSR